MTTIDFMVIALVFAAVFVAVLVIYPFLAELGGEYDSAGYMTAVRDNNPDDTLMLRFTTREKLFRAGWSAALCTGLLTASLLIFAGVYTPYIVVPICLLLATGGAQVPKLLLQWRIRKRQEKFAAGLLDLTFGLTSALRAGVSLPQALETVSRNMGGPVQEEISLMMHEYRLGVDLPDGLRKLCQRMPNEDLYLLATSVRLTVQSGGSLAEVLEKISETIRNRTEFRQKLQSMTAQGRFEAIAMALAPLAAFIILFVIDSELMLPLITTRLGYCALAVTAILEIIGFVCIQKIVTIED